MDELGRLQTIQAAPVPLPGQPTSDSRMESKLNDEDNNSISINTDLSHDAAVTENAFTIPDVERAPTIVTTGQSVGAISAGALAAQMKHYSFELEEARKRCKASMRDEGNSIDLMRVETEFQKEVSVWMQRVQSIIWPSSPEAIEYGRPVGGNIIPASGQFSLEEIQGRAFVLLRSALLPPAMLDVYKASRETKFSEVEDVVLVTEAFRWMSWCNIALNVMRVPVTTLFIKKLITAADGLKMGDDRLLRFFKNLLLRAQGWKSKARKMLYVRDVKLDTSKLNALLLEGNQIPFSSRIKDVIRTSMERVITASKPTRDDDVPGNKEVSEERAKRGPKTLMMPGLPAYTSLSSDAPNSSDEEMKSTTGVTPHFRFGVNYIATQLKVWPPTIPFPQSTMTSSLPSNSAAWGMPSASFDGAHHHSSNAGGGSTHCSSSGATLTGLTISAIVPMQIAAPPIKAAAEISVGVAGIVPANDWAGEALPRREAGSRKT